MNYLEQFNSKCKLPARSIATITNFYSFSTNKITSIRSILVKRLKAVKYKGEYCIVAVGSYGRYEASKQSDLDVYVIYSNKMSGETEKQINEIIKNTAGELKIKWSDGYESISLNDMQKNIGGDNDTNSSITNRILFLLESECLYNDPFFTKHMKKYWRST